MKLILFFTLVTSAAIQAQQYACVTKQNLSGNCKNWDQCPQARQSYSQGIYPTFCSDYVSICCVNQYNTKPEPKFGNSQRISEQKCKEYSKQVVRVTNVAPLSLHTSIKNQQSFEDYKCVLSTGLIVGGEITKPGEFPHMAALGWWNYNENKFDFKCGGTLISENFVLTAAHCYSKSSNPPAYPVLVRLGDQNLYSRNDGAIELDVYIRDFIVHERYDRRTNKNDIAVIKLMRSVRFTDFIRPACLWQNESIPQRKTIATGFGKTDFASSNSDELMKVLLNIYDNNQCDSYVRNDQKLDSSQLCVGGRDNDGKDTCGGDSGGPIVITQGENKCIFYVIGITSFGNPYCGFTPGIYTKISTYIDWIEQKVWE